MFTTSECLQKYFLLHFLHCLSQFIQSGTQIHHITCTGSICNHSLKCGCHFSTLDINAHFRILLIAKFEFLKLHSKVHSFERMFEFSQVRLGPNIHTIYSSHTLSHTHYNHLLLQLVSVSSERDQAFEEKEVTTLRSNRLRDDNKQLLQR